MVAGPPSPTSQGQVLQDALVKAIHGDARVLEWLIVGAGITGVYALGNFPPEEREGVVVLDQQDRVGGLWAWLPRWQTVQNDPLDFCTEGFTTRKAVWTADDVCHMLEQKVRLQGLAQLLRLGTKLTAYEWSEKEQLWVCQATRLADNATFEIRARRIVLGTGKHAKAIIPDIPSDGSVEILHSSQVRDFSRVAGRRVAVVGAGASGLDLCMHSIEHGAADKIEWILREPRHFTGAAFRALWPIFVEQLLWGTRLSALFLNFWFNVMIYTHHALAGTLSWLPRTWFDMQRSQLVPGRCLLIANKHRVSRHVGASVSRVEAGAVHLTTGEVLPGVDMLLLGTGYGAPERPGGFQKPETFAGYLSTGRHHGKLYLLGEGLLDTTGSTPITSHLLYDSTFREIAGSAAAAAPGGALSEGRSWPPEGSDLLLNSFDILEAVAPLARGRYPWITWRVRMAAVYLYYRIFHKTTVLHPERVIRTGLNLDDMPRTAPQAVAANGHTAKKA